MAVKKPLAVYSGVEKELKAGDLIPSYLVAGLRNVYDSGTTGSTAEVLVTAIDISGLMGINDSINIEVAFSWLFGGAATNSNVKIYLASGATLAATKTLIFNQQASTQGVDRITQKFSNQGATNSQYIWYAAQTGTTYQCWGNVTATAIADQTFDSKTSFYILISAQRGNSGNRIIVKGIDVTLNRVN